MRFSCIAHPTREVVQLPEPSRGHQTSESRSYQALRFAGTFGERARGRRSRLCALVTIYPGSRDDMSQILLPVLDRLHSEVLGISTPLFSIDTWEMGSEQRGTESCQTCNIVRTWQQRSCMHCACREWYSPTTDNPLREYYALGRLLCNCIHYTSIPAKTNSTFSTKHFVAEEERGLKVVDVASTTPRWYQTRQFTFYLHQLIHNKFPQVRLRDLPRRGLRPLARNLVVVAFQPPKVAGSFEPCKLLTHE